MTTSHYPIVSRSNPLWLLVSIVLFSGVGDRHSYAQGTIYTSRSGFNAAVGSTTTITFESLSPSSPSSTGTSPIFDSGVAFTNAEARLFITSPTSGLYPIPGTGQYLWNFDSSYPVGILLPGAWTAFGADFSGGTQTSFQANLTANFLSGQSASYNFSGTVGSFTFLGITFSEPIVSLVYSDGGNFLPGSHEEMLDNITFGAAISEPALSLLGIVGGLNWLFVRWLTKPRHAARIVLVTAH